MLGPQSDDFIGNAKQFQRINGVMEGGARQYSLTKPFMQQSRWAVLPITHS